MSTTALALITRSYKLLGVLQPGETPDAALAQDALVTLNQMLGGWSRQSLTIPSVAREVFGLTANLGVYTMGPGGDFDTSRPPYLTGAGLLLNSNSTVSSVASLTSSGNVATATVTSHGKSTGQNVTIAGASPQPYNGTFPITVTGVSTFTYVFNGTATTPATGTITALFESQATDVTEIPRSVITDDAWQAIPIKSLTNALFTCVYFNPTYYGGLATVNLWPIPDTGDNSLVLYRPQQLTRFANLSTAYEVPEGAEEALESNLAKRLIPYNGVDAVTAAEVKELARETLGVYKRGNAKLADLPIDPAFTMGQRTGGYNINTDGYSGYR